MLLLLSGGHDFNQQQPMTNWVVKDVSDHAGLIGEGLDAPCPSVRI